jgi:putative toxin-antitoxin system antitoxin component (TIGR02293 family)
MLCEALRHSVYLQYRAQLEAYLEISESDSRLDIHTKICLGFPATHLEKLINNSVITSPELSQINSLRTLKRRIEKKQSLTITESDNLFRIIHIRSIAEAIFGSPDKASRWLSKPQKRLFGETPLNLLTTFHGTSLVEYILFQISEGLAL